MQAVWSLGLRERSLPGRKLVVWLGYGGPNGMLVKSSDPRNIQPFQRYQREITDLLVDARITLDVIGPGGGTAAQAPKSAAEQVMSYQYDNDFGFAGYISATGGQLKNGNDVRGEISIEEHYTDTAGFTDHVFALMHLLGFRFAPRIRDLSDTKLYLPPSKVKYQALKAMTGGTINLKAIRTHWNEILRLATSIKQGTVTASLMLRKLGSYPRQNGLAVALRELGRIERTLFVLSWVQSVDIRRRVHAELNKGEARNALARAVFLCRLGEIRDRSFEQQRYRASGLTLVTAAIALWNTVYIERAVQALSSSGQTSTPSFSNTCRHSVGNTSTSPGTTNGVESGPHRDGSEPSGPLIGLSVLYCPFSYAAPYRLGIGAKFR